MARVDRAALEAAKSASVFQVLFKCSRILNERAVLRISRSAKAGPVLRPAHTTLLPHITFEGIRLTELARKLGVTKQAVSQLVADMAELDVVEYVPDPSDARAKLVRFTPEGARAILHGLTVLRTLEAEMEARIGKRKMHDLRGALDAMLAALEADETEC